MVSNNFLLFAFLGEGGDELACLNSVGSGGTQFTGSAFKAKESLLMMWEKVQQLCLYAWERWFQPGTRVASLWKLRQALLQEPSNEKISTEEKMLVGEMMRIRESLLAKSGVVQSCSSCAKGCPLPHGRWDGGFCCSGHTDDIFNPVEVAFLRASGAQPIDFQPPASEHAGCAFRGPTSCSLQPKHRPNLCLYYICDDLSHELASKGRWDDVDHLAQQLRDALEQFARLREERLLAQEVTEWEKESKRTSNSNQTLRD